MENDNSKINPNVDSWYSDRFPTEGLTEKEEESTKCVHCGHYSCMCEDDAMEAEYELQN